MRSEEQERWRRIALVFDQALALTAEERSAFLDGACGDDDELRQQVVDLLGSSDRASGFLGQPFPLTDGSITHDTPLAAAAEVIGPYRLIEKIGEGGMGEVWRAEQSAPIRRQVALKLIKSGMDTRRVVARFEGERQALAWMDHPAIARVYDAGETPRGLPYFVMELVPGVPITEYCDRQRLTVGERLELFKQVCEGVQHAQQRGIIHRDLKPSNILVAVDGGKPAPKIIDFGVAKATAAQFTDNYLHTELGMMIGTPEYMSPEQAEMTAAGVDTRTDVYSLGVLLYELLTGVLPFDSRQMREAGYDELRRCIREEDPPRPSTRVSTLGDSLTAVAQSRRTDPGRLVSRLRGELDWIVLRAMEKDRARRYASPGELAADIERSLRNEPVLAGPPGVVYRTRKFVRRHRVGVVVATTAVVGLVAFAITMSVQSVRIAKERDRANREAQASQRVSDFLVGIFRVSDPSVSDGTKLTAREVLANGAAGLDKDLRTDPLIQAKLFVSVGLIYLNLGLYKDAEPMFEKSLDIRRRLLGAEHGDTLLTMHCLAATYGHLGKYGPAEKLGRETLDTRRRVLGVESLYTLQTASVLSKVYTASGKPRAAAAVLDELIAARGGLPNSAGGVGVKFDVLNTLAGAHVMLGQYARAESESRELREQMIQKYGKESLTSLWSRNFSASACFLQGKYDEARTLYRDGFEASRKQYGPDHKITMSLQAGLAASSFFAGSRDEAMAMERQVLETARRVFGPQAAETQQQLFALGMMSLFENRYAAAEEHFRQASDGFRRLTGPVGYSTLWAESGLAVAALRNGKIEEARRILASVIEASPQTLGAEHPHTRDALRHLAEVYAAEQRDAEAERLFHAALADVPPETWQDPRVRSASFFGLAGLEARRGERAQALDHLHQAVALGFDDPAALSRSSRFDALRSDPAFAALRARAEENARRPPAAPTF